MRSRSINEEKVREMIRQALKEDIGTGDITTENLIEEGKESQGHILAKEDGVLAGLNVCHMVFYELNEGIEFRYLKEEGDRIEGGEKIAELRGPTGDILKGERVALNFLQRLSGIATKTRRYVEKVNDLNVRIVDTRKTTPNLRILEKYAVRVGGAHNHRMGLYDAVLIKENHIRSMSGITEAVARAKENVSHTVKIEVETEDIAEVDEAIEAGADIIMLDNMDEERMKRAVEKIGERAIIEASGGITLENVREVAETGVDIISVGALTHQIGSIDISLGLQ